MAGDVGGEGAGGGAGARAVWAGMGFEGRWGEAAAAGVAVTDRSLAVLAVPHG